MFQIATHADGTSLGSSRKRGLDQRQTSNVEI